MKKTTKIIFTLFTFISAQFIFLQHSSADTNATEIQQLQSRLHTLEAESQIRYLLQEYMEVLQAADWDTYLKYFTQDAKIIMSEGTVQGHEAIKNRMANATARMAKAREGQPVVKRAELLSSIKIKVTGNSAHAQSRFTFISQRPDGGFEVAGSGLYIDEWVLDGATWRMRSRTVDYDMLRVSNTAKVQ
jgi:3-phenylpropionate/cinnamic acid dioxygenase small subunit